MNKYKLVLLKSVKKIIKMMDEKLRSRVKKSFVVIEENPHIGKKLKGKLQGYYSYKVRPLRIIYRINKQKLEIIVIKTAHRKGAY